MLASLYDLDTTMQASKLVAHSIFGKGTSFQLTRCGSRIIPVQ